MRKFVSNSFNSILCRADNLKSSGLRLRSSICAHASFKMFSMISDALNDDDAEDLRRLVFAFTRVLLLNALLLLLTVLLSLIFYLHIQSEKIHKYIPPGKKHTYKK